MCIYACIGEKIVGLLRKIVGLPSAAPSAKNGVPLLTHRFLTLMLRSSHACTYRTGARALPCIALAYARKSDCIKRETARM